MGEIYSYNNYIDRDRRVKEIRNHSASETNKTFWNELPEETKEVKREHMRRIQQKVDRSSIRYHEPWNKGKTKHDDKRLMMISEQRTGSNNPMYGIKMSEEEKNRKSKLIKERIKTGQWTPHVHNCRTQQIGRAHV